MKYYFLLSVAVLQFSLAATAAATAAGPDNQLRRHRRATATARRSLDWGSDLWNLITGDGGGGGDWEDIDFQNIDWDTIVSNLEDIDIDWDSIDWNGGGGGWGDWLENWSSVVPDDFGVCSVVETAVGMSGQFVDEANCACVGDLETGLEIDCSFRGCAFESTDDETCGNVQLAFSFGSSGEIDVSVCTDWEDDDFEKICFGYGIDVTNGFDFDPASQTCDASYGDLVCDCSLSESFCLSIDCSDIMEGAKTDTCQLLSLHDDEGAGVNAFVPELAAFRSTGEENDVDVDVDGDAVEFEYMGKTKTCGWAREKLDKMVAAGTADGGKKKKAKRKVKKFCGKTKVKVGGEKDRLGNVCEEACGDAKEAL